MERAKLIIDLFPHLPLQILLHKNYNEANFKLWTICKMIVFIIKQYMREISKTVENVGLLFQE